MSDPGDPPAPMSDERLAEIRKRFVYLTRWTPSIVTLAGRDGLDLLAEVDYLRAIAVGAVSELRNEHQRDPQVDGCVMCWPKDGHWPCTSALIADDLAARPAGEQ